MGEIRCNKCGRRLVYGEGKQSADYLKVTKEWGYFSNKDLELHEFCLCENCYDEITKDFQIPIMVKEKTEILGNEECF